MSVPAIGSVVKSLTGRDKKRVFMIIGLSDDGERVKIADGKLRLLSKPKIKSLGHIAVLAAADPDLTSIPGTDGELYEYLTVFEGKLKNQNAKQY